MRMEHGLAIEQTQKLIITPELRQAIAILQLSSQDLLELIEQEIENNPILEITEDQPEQEEEEEDLDEQFDPDWQEYFQDSSDLGYNYTGKDYQEENLSYENLVTKHQTLHEYLTSQLHLTVNDSKDLRIGEFLIGCIDDNGYFRYPVKDVAKYLKKSEEDVLRVLKIIQTFDPPGVGARNIKECLLIQVNQMDNKDPLVVKVIQDYLVDLAENRCQKLANALGISLKRVQEIADFIRNLEPKPGRMFFGSDEVRYIVPDVVVKKVNGEYLVIVNDSISPRLTVNSYYKNILAGREEETGSVTKKFIENRLNSALWLIKSIEQRRMTLQKVVEEIVKHQREFLDRGIKYLRPLTLKQVADRIEMHESTVSRATANKYVQTPQGIFELRYFFTSGVEREEGETASSESIKKMIEDLIKEEDPKKPLSDQKIADILASRGINISRRTVAKYRDAMGLLPSNRRRRY
ncbi:MAG TPA: RNA polymerase factor sigma-54 [Clostridia bacterium]|nr:RNA polymerase factor sigma-54 [Clostridia bacterium]